MMKKMVVIAVIVGMVAPALFAESQYSKTASINLQGTIPEVVAIEVSTENVELDLTQSVTNKEIATVTEISNLVNSTYEVTLMSTNGFVLDGEVSEQGLPYTLTYGGAAVEGASGPVTLTTSQEPTGLRGVKKALAISYGQEELLADTYRDTLTFTITSK